MEKTVAFETARRMLGKTCRSCVRRGTAHPGTIQVRVADLDGEMGITEEIFCTRSNPCGYRRHVRRF